MYRAGAEPHRALIEEAVSRGRNAKAIWQELVDRHGFDGHYESVKETSGPGTTGRSTWSGSRRHARRVPWARRSDPFGLLCRRLGTALSALDLALLGQAVDQQPHRAGTRGPGRPAGEHVGRIVDAEHEA